ncbi:6,7-dimethyl-8-ribityllumazine synthase [Legionella micdadei]|uniref:6,7-dimethyl-8-ribityllumazine synthase n=1 Tax=Legionella micdadei TaxID=451 RepID=A0A098GJV0_LEGMI|nr:6,7-dimethyl-8-ribityllumazine synthase [Legionella micdadei]ARG98674.1 6,7-dimethyl-8-ribityllumazine synthase [Legionella micdadei]ARH01388.1 6,7-dimethyl-8-ribityllumazine synthase [Legionella micdadei]KTD28882.1 6,7-dimethyl-8-ribityllumazine synthase [Legionella micdadei]NSL17094.1 6,7-dimethyl-8-ribityllumazine synthase [Legionella micdadei]CEG62262.1 putative 6,7-dimethyl-8-ribityllumazine synthase (Riboflavinsynthase) [Legionella micdadei]
MAKILIISANIHKELSEKQLAYCVDLVKKSTHEYQIEVTAAGTYEIPFIINAYHQKNPFDGYIALGLVLKKNLDHHDFIMSHIKECFTRFALNNIPVGNGIISATTLEELASKVDSRDPCLSAYQSAFNAVDYLIKLKNQLNLKS